MNKFGKVLAISAAIATGPLLAYAAVGVRDYIVADGSDDDFSLDGAFVPPNGDIQSSDGTMYVYGPGAWWWGSGGGDGGTGAGGGSSSDPRMHEDPPPSEPPVCERGDGDIRMTFDGRTIRITAKYKLTGAGAATSGAAYVQGIEDNWTVYFPAENIGIETELVEHPSGFDIRIESYFNGREGLQPIPGGNWEMQLGTLDNLTPTLFQWKMRVAAHEFGYFWFGANLPLTSQNPLIMADPDLGRVLPSDLRALVQACETGGYSR